MDVPNQVGHRRQKHFSEKTSPEKEFRSHLRITPKIDHWHLRETKKRMVDLSFTVPHPRR